MKKLVGLLAMFAVSAAFVLHAQAPSHGLMAGDIAPDVKLKHIDGKEYSLSELSTHVKGFIVAFTCNTCPYAVMYEDRLKQLHSKYADLGFPVIAINPNDVDVKPADSFGAMQARYEEKEYNFLYLQDANQEIFPKFGATKTPHVYVLDKYRMVKYIGSIDDNPQDATAVKVKYVEDAVKAIMAGKDPQVKYTKAVGCSIKVKAENKHLLKPVKAAKAGE